MKTCAVTRTLMIAAIVSGCMIITYIVATTDYKVPSYGGAELNTLAPINKSDTFASINKSDTFRDLNRTELLVRLRRFNTLLKNGSNITILEVEMNKIIKLVEFDEHESSKTKIQESSEIKINESSKINIGESNNIKINESSKIRINESSSIKINESSEIKINESSEIKINDSSKIKINESSKIKINESSKIIINELSKIKINESSKIKINESSRIKINESSKIKINESSKIKINESSRIKINESSKIKINESSKIKINESSKIKINESSKIKINESSKIKINESSKIKINESSKIKINQSSKIKINESSKIKINESSKIKINESSKIKINESSKIKINESSKIKINESSKIKINESSKIKINESSKIKLNESAKIKINESSEIRQQANMTDDGQVLEVCPEVWKNKIDYPFWFKGFLTENCSNVVPFHSILSILLFPQDGNGSTCAEVVNRIAMNLNESYGKVPILVASVKNACKNVTITQQVQVFSINDSEANPGQVWNTLVQKAATRYVLIGRDVDSFMWMPNLERSVRVISYDNKSLQVVGGAIRNRTAHWRIGCYQSSMRNYVLEYKEGYYKSKNECMFCDSLAGPFVARRDLLQQFPLDTRIAKEMLFEDFFLKIKQESYSVANCPDVMYFASDPALERKLTDRSVWFPLVKKWGLNRVVLPNRHVFHYSCAESGIKCTGMYGHTKSFLIPICCLEQFGKAVALIDNYCRSKNLRYEYEAGSTLGIVKSSGLMPWDLDGDLTYIHYNLSVYKEAAKEFKKEGITFNSFEENSGGSYFKLHTPDLYIEMIGELMLSYDDPRAVILRDNPTQALMHGHWVSAHPSPGLYARNRYGIEMLRHTHSWLHLGMKGGAPYTSGYFKKCKEPKHHACLDHFSVDGNIQFQVPN